MLKCSCKWLNQGLFGWALQRATALFMLLYFVPILFVWLTKQTMGYDEWSLWLSSNYMLVLLLLNLGAFFIHAFIGLWTVCTDYIHFQLLRYVVLAGISLYMLGCLGWAFIAIIF